MSKATQSTDKPPRIPRTLALQLCVQAAVTLWPYAMFQPWYLSALGALLLAWRGTLAWQDRPAPPGWLLMPLAFVGLATIILTYGNPVGRLPGLALLNLLLPLKMLETRNTRDVRAALLLNFFLIIGMFLHEQSALIGVAAALATLGSVATAARLQRTVISPTDSLWQALRLLAQGVPLMLALFVLFPRIDGPLWGLPIDAYSGKTGLSDHMTIGSISNLIPSGEIAFRAAFNGPIPPPADRYWRGPVLTYFDGTDWKQISAFPAARPFPQPAGRKWQYTMTLEAHDQRWLLALDYPTASDNGRFTAEMALAAAQPVRKRIRYDVQSSPDLMLGMDEAQSRLQAALSLPSGFNPRTVAQGRQIAASTLDNAERVSAAIRLMQKSHLQYTLSPPLLGRDSVDDFLFNTHSGFCEHFAAAFVVLMRAASVPARVVTGYQGGEFNPVDSTLVIRQSDAHAWAEVWLGERGWVRVDPTAASFPSRIADGVAGSLPATDALPLAVRSKVAWLRGLRYRWEAIGNAWNQWVLGYNAQRQMELMQRLGIDNPDWKLLASLMASSAGLWLLWVVWRHFPKRQKRDALDRSWQRFCRKMAQLGLPREPWESPNDYAKRIASTRPQLRERVENIAELYTTYRFGRTAPTATDITQLAAYITALSSHEPRKSRT
jgi:transglutaminase-like putative cysteine protease